MKELRRQKLMTQRELATAVEVRYQTVQRWESAARYPRPVQLRKLCAVLDVTPSQLLAALDETKADAEAAANGLQRVATSR
jgi:transcriptional regulator with XRE-family HTH domain